MSNYNELRLTYRYGQQTAITLSSNIIQDFEYQNQNITAVEVPEIVEEIGEYAFCDNSLTSITLNEGLEMIHNQAFQHGTYSAITIPSTVTYIGVNAFNINDEQGGGSAGNLTITCLATVPPMLVDDEGITFGDPSMITAIYVPSGSVSSYQSAWPQYASIIQGSSPAPADNILTNLDIASCYVGNSQVDKIYLGSEVIWPTEIDYSTEPLTLNARDNIGASIMVNNRYSGGTVYYKEKDSTSWSSLTPGTVIPVYPGHPIQLMGYSGATGLFSGGTQSGEYEVYGNVMSLIYGENFTGQTTIPSSLVDCFYSTFRNCEGLVSIKNLVMPATTLSQGCYRSMFNKCWYLTELPDVFIPSGAILTSACCRYTFEELGASASTPVVVPSSFLPSTNLAEGCYEDMFKTASISSAPELPATTLAVRCYWEMFRNCTRLATAPELPATTLANYCYAYMFNSCTSLTTAPELPAMTLADYCYQYMFNSCTSLTTAPELPATILAQYCYNGMFSSCRSLIYITCLATDISANRCTTGWIVGVASSGTFIKAASMTGWGNGANGIPIGWTVQDYVVPNP